MSDFNSAHNRAVWFDIPVADLDRAAEFYRGVLAIGVEKVQADGLSFCVLQHDAGNGGCLVPKAGEVAATAGILLYMNVDGRMGEAVGRVSALGGKVLEPTHAIGAHGFRTVILDSEGNRIALHSTVAS